jgi:vacuolar-type H+-ATPase subunit E/Vma4
MEAAHRQTRAHLERIERQISARAERMTTTAKAKARRHPRGGSRWTRSDETMFRACVDQLSFERRGEIEALSRKLIRQEHAITVVRAKTISYRPAAKADVHAAL